MLRGISLLVLTLTGTWPSESMAGDPAPAITVATPRPSGPPPAPLGSIEPPREIGTALVLTGSLGIVAGAGGVAIAPFLGHGPWGAISLGLGVGSIVAGSIPVIYGARRRAALRRWQAKVGMNRHVWHRRYRPGRPVSSGTGLITVGVLSLGLGAGLGWVGIVQVTSPNWDDGVPLELVVNGAVGMVSGVTMIVMGSVQDRRYNRWRPAGKDFELTAYPWATRTAAGLGFGGRFSL
jgi:hypothetical protein